MKEQIFLKRIQKERYTKGWKRRKKENKTKENEKKEKKKDK